MVSLKYYLDEYGRRAQEIEKLRAKIEAPAAPQIGRPSKTNTPRDLSFFIAELDELERGIKPVAEKIEELRSSGADLIAPLPFKYRQVLKAKDFYISSWPEIADITGYCEKTCRRHYEEAINELRKKGLYR